MDLRLPSGWFFLLLGAILITAAVFPFGARLRKRVVSKSGPPDTVWASST